MTPSASLEQVLTSATLGVLLAGAVGAQLQTTRATPLGDSSLAAQQGGVKNVVFFVGDGMGVSTVSAARIFSVGVDGELVMDQLPFTALSRTYTTDFITPDSAGTMTAMITGVNTNSGVISMDPATERNDFNQDGDGAPLTTLLELAKQAGKKVGIVSTARFTHATPAACFSHVNDRNKENDIALQALPTEATFNQELMGGLDLVFGGGRRHLVPNTKIDEEGKSGSRQDGRDLRAEFQAAGYSYVWNKTGFQGLAQADLPVMGALNSSHMEYEYDRLLDTGGEPSLEDMTRKAIELLDNPNGFVLIIESGRIDHAHHAGNAWRAMVETEELDESIGAATEILDLNESLVVVTADHSHVFNIAGYPMRQLHELPYTVNEAPLGWIQASHGGLFNTVYGISSSSGIVSESGDADGVPYTALVYANGPGYRSGSRVDPFGDTTPGYGGVVPSGPNDPAYLQEAAVPMGSETHSAEDVTIYAIGAGSRTLRGTVKNTFSFDLMRKALGL